MKETNDFLMPEYYTEFECKKGECRTACCTGWPISVSQENYFRLLGMDCPKHLRDRLDVGLRMADHPTPEHFAQFNPRYDGNCPMRMEDGRCSIHAELGEEYLADVCRLYPRGIRADGAYECSCANSCEAIPEMFLRMREPMRFIRRRITVDVPDGSVDCMHAQTENDQSGRMEMIAILEDRSISLPDRLLKLRAYLRGGCECLNILYGDGVCGTEILLPMAKLLADRHDSFREFGEAAVTFFEADTSEKYMGAKADFENSFPEWSIFAEHLLVNHVFFSRFPRTERNMPEDEVWRSLVLVYALIRFTVLGYTHGRADEAALIDAVSSCFRMIEHTEFEMYGYLLMKKFRADDDASIADLLCI